MKKNKLLLRISLPALLIFNICTCYSQIRNVSIKDSAGSRKWHFILEPYMMLGNLKGTMGLGNLPDATVDEDVSDIFSELEAGIMLYGEIYNDRWAFSSDLTYMRLSAEISTGTIVQSGESVSKQWAWELAALRKLLPWLEGGIGAQLNSISADLDFVINTGSGPEARSASGSKSWVDPIIIARVKTRAGNRWPLLLRANIGGFGIGSKLTWQIQAYLGFQLSDLITLGAGYRVLNVDYEKGDGEDRFLYDVTSFGPVIKVTFTF